MCVPFVVTTPASSASTRTSLERRRRFDASNGRYVGPTVEDGLHELVDHVEILVALEPPLIDANIGLVFQQLLVVRSDVKHDLRCVRGVER